MTENSRERTTTDNFLDKRFQSMILPIRCMKHMFFKSCFSVKNNCIRPHSVSYYIVSLIGTLVFIIFQSLNYLNGENFKYYSFFLNHFSKFNRLMLTISFFVFYCINILQSENNVRMILKIQEAFRIIDYKDYIMYTIRNWIWILLKFIMFVITAPLSANVPNAFYFFSLIYFDVSTTYGIRIISLLRDGVITWISDVELYSKLHSELEEHKHDEKLKKLLHAYAVLLEAFDIFKRIFQFAILSQALSTFFHSLQFFEISIEYEIYLVNNFFSLSILPFQIATVVWISRNLILIIMFSANCEKFYMTVCDADGFCSSLLKTNQKTTTSKRLCKNVLRLNRAAFHKMTACRMFTIDGRLPQEFGYLVLEYLVMLLQFALLLWNR